MGIKGSSTRQVFYEDVVVPAENIVGEIGRGHKIAFNALNIGRIKMAASSLGGARYAMELARAYAQEREQFGQKIATFGAIQYKLAEMATRCYVLESAVYRTAHDIQAKETELLREGLSENEALLGAAEEYAAECALLKLYGSEVLGYCVDEAVQIHGGNGFSAEYPVERCYRDARIVRIYEGTSEINRILAVNMILKRGLAGRFALEEALQQALDFPHSPHPHLNGREAVHSLKQAALMCIGLAIGQDALGQQMLSMNLSDMILEAFLAESALLRAERILSESGKEAARRPLLMSRLFLHDASERAYKLGKDVLAACLQGEALGHRLAHLRSLTDFPPVNVMELRTQLLS